MTRVVVTGGTGNLGTAIVARLLSDPRCDSVVTVARRRPSSGLPGVEHRALDVASDRLHRAVDGADVVIHCAWLFQPTRDPAVTWRVNAVGSRRVFDAAVAAGVEAIVHASSVGAYSPGPGRRVDESWPTDGTSSASYAREKAYVERALDAIEATHPQIRVVRIRPGFLFQPSAATEQRRLFAGPLLPRRLVRPGLLPVVPVPARIAVQAADARDAADAFVRAALGDARGAFNVAADDVIDADAIAGALGARPLHVPNRLVRAAVSVGWRAQLLPAHPALVDLALDLPLLDCSRARSELGWAPERSGVAALTSVLVGIADGSGGPTAPLAPDSFRGRVTEVVSGIGRRP